MPSPIQPIGFDLPSVAPVKVEAPPQLAQPSSTGMAVIAQAQQSTQQTLQSQQQYAAQSAQIATQTADAYAQSARAISQSAAVAANTIANRGQRLAQSTANLTETLSNMSQQYAERDQKQREAEAKAAEAARKEQLAKNKAEAVDRLEKLQAGWIQKGYIDTVGPEAYRKAIADKVAEYELDPDTIVELTQKYYAPGMDYAKRTEENRQKTAATQAEALRRINSQKLRNRISASLGTLASSSNLSNEAVTGITDTVNQNIAEYLKDESIPLVDRLVGVADSYEATGKILDSSNAKKAEINAKATAYRNVADYAAEQMQLVNTNAMPYSQYKANVEQRAVELGLDSFTAPDPLADQAYLNRALQGEDAIRELSQKKELSAREAITANDDVIGGLATEAFLSPAAYATLQAEAKKGGNTNAVAALDYVDRFRTFKDKTEPEYRVARQRANSDLVAINDNFNTWFISQTKPQAQRSPQVESFLNELRQRNIPVDAITQPESGRITPEQVEFIRQSKINLRNAKMEEMRVLDENYKNAYAPFQRVGLSLDVETVKTNNKRQKESIDSYRKRLEQAQQQSTVYTPPGVSPNFNGGAPGKTPQTGTLMKRSYAGKTITLPVVGGAAISMLEPGSGSMYGAPRTATRDHDGLDFPVPTGTQAVSLVYGTVQRVQPADVEGFGINVEVLGDDGFIYHYAHLSRINAVNGQRVGPGQVIALTGNTGRGLSTGPHLHLGVYATDGKGNFTGSVDPLSHLATRSFGANPKLPRTSGDSGSRPSVPAGAIPLGKDTYLLGGQVIRAASPSPQPATYTQYRPMASSFASRNVADYPHGLPADANHGYQALAADKQLAAAINKTANGLGIPGQWLADLIAVETAGTFSASIPNNLGYYGLIQFGPEARADLGVTLDELTHMTPAQQMTYVGKYLRLQMRYAGVSKLKGPEWLVAAVNQGNVVLGDVDKRGEAAVLDPENRDGAGVTLKDYMEMLGKYSGRKYDYLGNRANRLRASVHTYPHDGCPICQNLAASGTTAFVPHEDTSATV